MKITRYVLASLAGIFGALMLYAALTVPMIAAGGPAVLAVGALVAAFVLFPRKKKAEEFS